VFPKHRLKEAAQYVPRMRAFALEHVPDLSPDEHEAINSREPEIGHANYVVYYFWWSDAAGRPLVTVEASPPPCEPRIVRRSVSGKYANAVDRAGR
jgi:hypothetical protein